MEDQPIHRTRGKRDVHADRTPATWLLRDDLLSDDAAARLAKLVERNRAAFEGAVERDPGGDGLLIHTDGGGEQAEGVRLAVAPTRDKRLVLLAAVHNIACAGVVPVDPWRDYPTVDFEAEVEVDEQVFARLRAATSYAALCRRLSDELDAGHVCRIERFLAQTEREPGGEADVGGGVGGEAAEPRRTDQPDEHGYVAEPADKSVYIPTKDIISEECEQLGITMTPKKVGQIVEDYRNNQVRWSRPVSENTGKSIANRRRIHLMDWRSFVKRCGPQPVEDDGWPSMDEAELGRF